MKLRRLMILAFTVLGIAAPGFTYDHFGLLGLNYTLGPSFIAGGSHATDVSSVEPGVGAGLQYSLLHNVDVRLDYDYIDADLRTQAITFGGQYRLAPAYSLNPYVGAGLGFGKPRSGEGWDHFSLKLTGGMEKELTPNVSIGPVISYQYVQGPGPFGSVHVIEPGIRLVYFFDNLRRR